MPIAPPAAIRILDADQVDAYAADLLRRYPALRITRHVACTISAAEFRFFALDGLHRHP